MANPQVGPWDVKFNNNAGIGDGGNGVVLLATGTDTQRNAEFRFNPDGSMNSSSGSFATEEFVQNALNGYTPSGLASEDFVNNAIGEAVGGLASEAYVDQKLSASVDWIAPTLQNGWANYINSSNGASAGYRLKNGRVELRGLVAGGSKNQVIFTLPQAYRVKEPSQYKQIQLACTAAEKHANLLVKSTGEVVVNAHDAASLTWVSLNGISFPID